jgi:hypothetical protein
MHPWVRYLAELQDAYGGTGGVQGLIALHPVAIGVGALVVVSVVSVIVYFAFIYEPPAPPVEPVKVYMYDLGSNQLFTAKGTEVPPIDSPSGKHMFDGSLSGVRAYVYACGGCANADKRFAVYVEKFDPDAQATWRKRMALRRDAGVPAFDADNEPYAKKGRLISKPQKIEWVDISSPEAADILALRSKKCKDGSDQELCNP